MEKKRKEKLISVTFIPHGGLKTAVTVTLESPDKRRPLNDRSPSGRHADIRKHKYTGHGTITHDWSHRMAAFAPRGNEETLTTPVITGARLLSQTPGHESDGAAQR